jgi:hypothetical protein
MPRRAQPHTTSHWDSLGWTLYFDSDDEDNAGRPAAAHRGRSPARRSPSSRSSSKGRASPGASASLSRHQYLQSFFSSLVSRALGSTATSAKKEVARRQERKQEALNINEFIRKAEVGGEAFFTERRRSSFSHGFGAAPSASSPGCLAGGEASSTELRRSSCGAAPSGTAAHTLSPQKQQQAQEALSINEYVSHRLRERDRLTREREEESWAGLSGLSAKLTESIVPSSPHSTTAPAPAATQLSRPEACVEATGSSAERGGLTAPRPARFAGLPLRLPSPRIGPRHQPHENAPKSVDEEKSRPPTRRSFRRDAEGEELGRDSSSLLGPSSSPTQYQNRGTRPATRRWLLLRQMREQTQNSQRGCTYSISQYSHRPATHEERTPAAGVTAGGDAAAVRARSSPALKADGRLQTLLVKEEEQEAAEQADIHAHMDSESFRQTLLNVDSAGTPQECIPVCSASGARGTGHGTGDASASRSLSA